MISRDDLEALVWRTVASRETGGVERLMEAIDGYVEGEGWLVADSETARRWQLMLGVIGPKVPGKVGERANEIEEVINELGVKMCSGCKIVKKVEAFGPSVARRAGGLRSRCKKCEREARRK